MTRAGWERVSMRDQEDEVAGPSCDGGRDMGFDAGIWDRENERGCNGGGDISFDVGICGRRLWLGVDGGGLRGEGSGFGVDDSVDGGGGERLGGGVDGV